MTLSHELAPHLPPLRRYARALTGSQSRGDAYVRACLEAIAAKPDEFPRHTATRAALYLVFHSIWSSANLPRGGAAEPRSRHEKTAQSRLSRLPPQNRQAFLLTALEGFTVEECAAILRSTPAQVESLITSALDDIERQTRTRVLIIEDEPIVAMDLEGIVGALGHEVAGVARTRSEAADAATRLKPGLVLADIQLADGSSGVDAVHDILEGLAVPVIFITAFPDRLLTGEKPEPTFLITKPFDPDTVKATISQALFFDEVARLPA